MSDTFGAASTCRMSVEGKSDEIQKFAQGRSRSLALEEWTSSVQRIHVMLGMNEPRCMRRFCQSFQVRRMIESDVMTEQKWCREVDIPPISGLSSSCWLADEV